MQICKTVTFDAAHRLDKLPPEHKCARMHGHTYRVDLIVECPYHAMVQGYDWIIDYADLAKAWESLNAQLDHHYLNEVPGLSVPTTENLAMWILTRMRAALTHVLPQQAELARVRVYESSSSYCEAP